MQLRISPLLLHHSLKLRLVALISGAALAGSFALGGLISRVVEHQLERDKGQLLQQVATQMAGRLAIDLNTRAQEILFLAHLDPIRDTQRPIEAKRHLLELTKGAYPYYAWIGLTDREGTIVAGTGGLLEGKSVADRDWFLRGGRGLYFGDAHDAFLLAKLIPKPRWDDLPLRLVDVSAPIFDAHGELAGVLCGHLSLDWAFEVRERMLAGLNAPRTDMLVLDHDGRVLMGTPGLPSLQTTLGGLRAVHEAPDHPVVEVWPDTQEYLSVAIPDPGFGDFPGLGWTVLGRQPVASAFAPARQLARDHIFLGVLAALLFALLVWWILQRELRPLEAVSSAAGRICAAGELTTPIPQVAGEDEIGLFARSLTELVNKLQQRNEELRLSHRVFEEIAQGIMVTDPQQRILMINQAFTEITGYGPEEALGRTPHLLSSGRHDAEFYRQMWESIDQLGYWSGEIWNRNRQGELYPEWMNISVLNDAEGEVSHYIALFEDTSEKMEFEQRLQRLVDYDPLTGLPNRNLLQRQLKSMIEQVQRTEAPLAVLFIGLDQFKQINDSIGHAAGDRVLQEAANRLRTQRAQGSLLARWGGDEFVFALPGTDSHSAAQRAELMLRSLTASMDLNGTPYAIGASIGISLLPQDGEDAESLLRRADTALSQAKHQARGRFCFYEGRMNEQVGRYLQLSNALRFAIERNELQLYFQPQYDTFGRRILGAEALLRWFSPELGEVPPAHFISIAEETGQIIPMGHWIIEQTLGALGRLEEEGLAPIPISINVSTLQLSEPGLAAQLAQAMAEHQVATDLIKIEITESAFMEEDPWARHNLAELRDLGIAISIDDFGTGYSCLSYVTRLRPREIKIDKSFVQSMEHDSDSRNIVSFTIDLAQTLNLDVVAEGVETPHQLALLGDMGHVRLQGYLLSRPLPLSGLLDLLRPATQNH